jgi:hypothetical protein
MKVIESASQCVAVFDLNLLPYWLLYGLVLPS